MKLSELIKEMNKSVEECSNGLRTEAKKLGIHIFDMKTKRCQNCDMNIDEIKQKHKKIRVYVKSYDKEMDVWSGCRK